jgi:FkbH-like protein
VTLSPAADVTGIGPEMAEVLERLRSSESPDASECLMLARAFLEAGQPSEALGWCVRVADSDSGYVNWDSAARLLATIPKEARPAPKRHAKLAVLGSYTTSQLVDMLELVAANRGVDLDIYEAGYQQYMQEILDDRSGLWGFDPDFVLLAVHEADLELPELTSEPSDAVDAEVERWASIWDAVTSRSRAKVIQTNFVARPEDPFGHFSARMSGSRRSMVEAVNRRLGIEAGDAVTILDCRYLASIIGLDKWIDDRYWHLSKQAVGFDALPALATHLIATLGAELGISRKCLVLDLDGTLWGGVVGDDGWENLRLGDGPDGEAYVAFQEYVKSLKNRGIVLAVCSKNDEATAKDVFRKHPAMKLDLDDISMFVANWDPKPDNIRYIAESLDLGLDSLVFVDDHPGERASVRWALPDVDVLPLPENPGGFVRALGRYPFFAMASFTPEDLRRTEQYRARAGAATLKTEVDSLEDFLDRLDMTAVIGRFDEYSLNRVTQLVNKTNQFNLTGRRYSRVEIESMQASADTTGFHIQLSDRFGDHGIVAVAIGRVDGSDLEIDTFVMSCRVIGRTLETVVISELAERARDMGCSQVRGLYKASAKNGLVADLYERLGFDESGSTGDYSIWTYDVERGPVAHPFIEVAK